MTRPYRLTEAEQNRECPWCGAKPGQRCTSPDGRTYNTGDGVHVARRGRTQGIVNRRRKDRARSEP